IWVTVGIAGVILLVLALLQRKNVSFNKLVLIGLVLGLSFGAITQAIFGSTSKVVATTVDWIGIVGNGYISLLQMLVIPLIVIALISAFTKLGDTKNLGKIARNVLTVLLTTTAIAAFIGVITVIAFNLQGASFVKGTASKDNLAFL
ncbi:cation:dicarboxylase symporter family transporter, partial [Clostridioides difficile]|uniref:cation:dicarboxylate symporter family transporter n=1 Tax=Clostridioides difficile TaxID=1496 RepID=UPI0023589175